MTNRVERIVCSFQKLSKRMGEARQKVRAFGLTAGLEDQPTA